MFVKQFTLIILISHQILFAVRLRFVFVNCAGINYKSSKIEKEKKFPSVPCVEAIFDECGRRKGKTFEANIRHTTATTTTKSNIYTGQGKLLMVVREL